MKSIREQQHGLLKQSNYDIRSHRAALFSLLKALLMSSGVCEEKSKLNMYNKYLNSLVRVWYDGK